MSDADRCVCCGEIIPEGRQVCPQCEALEQTLDAEENRCYNNTGKLKNKAQSEVDI